MIVHLAATFGAKLVHEKCRCRLWHGRTSSGNGMPCHVTTLIGLHPWVMKCCIIQLICWNTQQNSLGGFVTIRFQHIEIINNFYEYLVEQALQYDAIVIGGTALALLGVITRTTRDVDLLTLRRP